MNLIKQMSTKQEHLDLIASKGRFVIYCSITVFATEEIELLEKYGHWFNALTSRELVPFTESQRRFVLVAEGKEDPFSLEEVAWWKYMDQMAYEARRRNGETIQYHVQNDTLYNRDMAKSLKSTMFKVMRDNHRK